MKRNILILHDSLRGGGAERVLLEIIKNFDYEKYTVTLILFFSGGRFYSQIDKRVETHCLYDNGFSKSYLVASKLCLQNNIIKRRLNRITGNKVYDTIISFMEGRALYLHSFILEQGLKNITWVHTNIITNPWSSKSFNKSVDEEHAYLQLDKIVFVSKLAKEAFVNKYKNIKTDMFVLNNPVDSVRILDNAVTAIKRDGFTICVVGRFVEAKRYDRLIEAANILHKKGLPIKYWLCGEGIFENEMKIKVAQYSLQDSISFMGFVDNPYPYIKAADVFVLCSDTEGYPTVICEALVLGKAIISTDVPGADELLGNSEFGIICNKTPEDLAYSIESLYNDQDLLKKYSLKAKERSSIFNVKETMNRFYQLID